MSSAIIILKLFPN